MDNKLTQHLLYSIAFSVLIAIFILMLLLPAFVSIELQCTRFTQSELNCHIVRQMPLQKASTIQIPKPLAVDITEYPQARGASVAYRLAMRSTRYSYPIPLTTVYDAETAYQMAQDINDFLLVSQEQSFHRKYPG